MPDWVCQYIRSVLFAIDPVLAPINTTILTTIDIRGNLFYRGKFQKIRLSEKSIISTNVVFLIAGKLAGENIKSVQKITSGRWNSYKNR
mgnify:CR=1 FL=1